jgi:hypothetical protein
VQKFLKIQRSLRYSHLCVKITWRITQVEIREESNKLSTPAPVGQQFRRKKNCVGLL